MAVGAAAISLVAVCVLTSFANWRAYDRSRHIQEEAEAVTLHSPEAVTVIPQKQLVIGILSNAGNADQRDALRNTYVGSANGDERINAFFWVGIGSGYTEYEELLAEKEKYNDIVLYYGRDTWENLSKKVFAMMVHADSTFEFDYFLKTDDDTFIDVQRLLEFTNGLPENRVYWGQRIKGANANPVGRWANP
eukprot:109494_1